MKQSNRIISIFLYKTATDDRMKLLWLFFIVGTRFATRATECFGTPDFKDFSKALNTVRQNETGHAVPKLAGIPTYTCIAQGHKHGYFRELSAIVSYTTDNDNHNLVASHFEFDCVLTENDDLRWEVRQNESVVSHLNGTSFSVETFTNCSHCSGTTGNPNRCKGGSRNDHWTLFG